MITSQQLTQLRDGSKSAFELLYRTYNARIYNFVLSLVGNEAVAMDITQDIFLHIWEKRMNIDVENNITGYLLKISQNMVYHYIRRELLLKNYLEHLSNTNKDVDIDNDINNTFLESYILKLVEELPPSRREIFMLYWKFDLSYKEIAHRLGISDKTVATQVHRSLNYLKVKLGNTAFYVAYVAFFTSQL